jgi:hypothetical protein
MLRIHRHYIPALVLVVVVADLGVIALALSSSQALGYPNGDGAMWPKAFVLTGVTLLALSLADLYQLDFRIRRVELTLRLVGAMLLGITADAAIGYVHPPFGLGRLSFVHTLCSYSGPVRPLPCCLICSSVPRVLSRSWASSTTRPTRVIVSPPDSSCSGGRRISRG